MQHFYEAVPILRCSLLAVAGQCIIVLLCRVPPRTHKLLTHRHPSTISSSVLWVSGVQTVLPFATKGDVARGECLRVEVKLANGHDVRLDFVSIPRPSSIVWHQ